MTNLTIIKCAFKCGFEPIIWAKYLANSKGIKQNKTTMESFDLCFYVIFNHWYKKFT